MTSSKRRIYFTLALALGFLTSSAFLPGIGGAVAHAVPIYAFYEIPNPDNARAAVGMELTFDQKILLKNGDPDARSLSFARARLLDGSGGKGVDFDMGSILVLQSDRGTVTLDAPAGRAPATKLTACTLVYNIGQNLACAKPDVKTRVGKKDNGAIQITNDDTQTVFFSNVKVSTDIPSSNFLDPAAVIANELFAVVSVADFSLEPGETLDIDLGTVTGDNYTSVVFTLDFTSTPSSDAMRLGFAGNQEVLPEPATVALLGCGVLGLLAYKIRTDR
jgi:hypothetical protein